MGPLDRAIRTIKAGADRARARATARRRRVLASGQMLVLFVVSIFVLTGITAIVVDISWYWANTLRVQRAADAAALAGVVWLPGAPGTAYSTANDEASKNGYTDGTNGVVVYPIKDASNSRRLWVTITAPVNTFFMKIFGINSLTAQRMAKAEYVLPVPMGSPENYYGVFGLTRGLTSTTTTIQNISDYPPGTSGNSGWDIATTAPGTVQWGVSSGAGTVVQAVSTNNDIYAQTSTNGNAYQFGSFGLNTGLGAGQTIRVVNGIEVQLSDAYMNNTGCASSRIRVDLSWNNGGNWTSTTTQTAFLSTNNSTDYTLGSASSMAAWGGHSWVPADLSNANFRLRITGIKAGSSCAGATQIRLDMLEVRVSYTIETITPTPVPVTTNLADVNLRGPGSNCTTGKAVCYEADGAALNPRGFWATMNTEGADNVNGDAFQPYYDTATSTVAPACAVASDDQACYDATTYYNYAVEMPPGSTGGSVYVYDPVFCDVAANKGTGDRWFGGSNGVSSYFELYNTQNTPYDITDDTQLATSSTNFQQISASDTTMGGSGGSECKYNTNTTYGDGRDYHNRWYRLYSGLAGGANGTTYRLHTTSTDPSNVAQQRNTNGESTFALYAGAAGGTPKIYGLGAMQMFTPLSSSGGSTFSEFYMAQVDAVHAGKTMEIKLWDPGDTNPLAANLQIEIPTSGGWSPTSFSWTAATGTSNSGAQSCNSLSGSGTSVVTNVGATTGTFNGCWLTIDVVIPVGYTAQQSGWWKIKYNMTGSGTSNDVTTWKVQIKGNPVHLIVP
jgi:hypothetical protein